MEKQIIEVSEYFLNSLDERQKNILERRFGLKGDKRETLEEIGRDFNITRERIRQIERKAIEKIKKQTDKNLFQNVSVKIKNFLNFQGGFKREDKISEELKLKKATPYLLFILYLGDDFYKYRENDLFYTFWTVSESKMDELKKVLISSISELEKINQPLEAGEFFKEFASRISNLTKLDLNEEIYRNYFEVFKPIEYGLDKKIGLIHWPEIKPRGVRDRAYVVLKNDKNPLHFRDIAKQIELLDNSKRVHIQSLHNELIKDERFVLVGRGYYGLKEMGYKEGVLKDVIVSIFKDSSSSLSKDEIINKVSAFRIVKPNTILSALYDKELFQKTQNGFYYLK